ncbi:hypothetical protein [Novosphingobium sp. JCM 18896]|uniref:hypothetical protein n=1 Tax=Novosphingobium sp. JCM 18896 TaxID=2989731 RepID=UPI00222305F6|nr:hypothetical protein [Novosphingobium sp. JCM 18896]MCW1432000.1 hypothetical protein [Novosphingobium sp. JCM 18896]
MDSNFHSPEFPPVVDAEASAIAAGFTKAVIADSSQHTLELLIKPDTDLDGTFEAYDRSENEMLSVNGWLFDISLDT